MSVYIGLYYGDTSNINHTLYSIHRPVTSQIDHGLPTTLHLGFRGLGFTQASSTDYNLDLSVFKLLHEIDQLPLQFLLDALRQYIYGIKS